MLIALGGIAMIVVAAALLVRDRTGVLAGGDSATGVRAHRVRGDVAGVLCVVGGLLVALGAASRFGYGRGQLMAALPALVGGCLLAVFMSVEGTWPRQAGPVRTASVRARRLADLGVGFLRGLVGLWAAGLVVAGIAFATVASGPRQASRMLDDGRELVITPFPGWWYGLPVLLAVAVLLGWGSVVIRLILTRPAVEGLDDDRDLGLRRASAGRVLGGLQLVLGLSLAAMLAAGGRGLRILGQGEGGTGSIAVAGPVEPGLVGAGGALMALAVVVVVVAVVGCVLPMALRAAVAGAPRPRAADAR